MKLLAAAALVAQSAAAQVKLDYASQSASYKRVLQLPSGDRLMVGSRQVMASSAAFPYPHWQMVLADFGSSFQPYPIRLGGSGNDVVQDAAVDPSGNVWIAGKTDSDDFYLVNPIVSRKVAYRTAGFVIELDPQGTKVLFASFLAGQQPNSVLESTFYATYATAIAIDSAGNAYVGGSTNESDFPTTSGAYLGGKGFADPFLNTGFYSFLMKISPAGKMVYSTELVTGASDCLGGSRCIGQMSTYANVTGLAIDSTGTGTVAGVQSGSWNPGNGYVLRVAADGSKLLWTATIGASGQAVLNLAMAQDSSGAVDLLAQYAPLVYEPLLAPTTGTPGLFAARLNADGSGLAYSTDFGQSADAQTAGVVLDSDGNAYFAGTDSSARFPGKSGVPNRGADFIVRLDTTGAAIQTLFRFPQGVIAAPPAFDRNGNFMLVGAQGALLSLPPTYAFDSPAIVGFTNSASNSMNPGLFPGTLITLYGFGLGASLESTRVTVNGYAAPLLYAGPNQINLQTPFEISATSPPVEMQVTLPGGSITLTLPVSQSIGIFTLDGVHAAALNQDGSVNSAGNPAAVGSIITLFGTGATWLSPMQDGAAAAVALPTQDTFELSPNDIGSRVLYSGTAPTLSNGVFQLNVQLPPSPTPTITIQDLVAADLTFYSNPVAIYLSDPSTSAGLGMPRRAN